MVYISKVYTKFGDEGQTMLASGETVDKHSPRVSSYGEVDELNAVVGIVRLELGREGAANAAGPFAGRCDAFLAAIQHQLFNLGSELSTSTATEGGARLRIESRHVEAIEAEIDELNESLEPLKSFVLPGGGPTGTAAHLARTVCRRAERRVLLLASSGEGVRSEARVFLNRLSDYFFVLARAAAKNFDHHEVLWDQENT